MLSVATAPIANEMPQCVTDWGAEGPYTALEGHSVVVHASGPQRDQGVLVAHGYPGSSWDWVKVVGKFSEKERSPCQT